MGGSEDGIPPYTGNKGEPVTQDSTAPQWVDAPASQNWTEGEERALRLWIALARCYVTFSRAVACKVAEYDLTAPQFGVMEALLHKGPLSLGELAEKLLVTGGNVTYVMDRLEAQGLVVRERSGDDRRVVRAHLTSKGRSRWVIFPPPQRTAADSNAFFSSRTLPGQE